MRRAVIVFFDVLAGFLFMFMGIRGVNLSQGFLVLVFLFVFVLFLVVLVVMKLGFFDFGFSRGFELFVVFLFVLVFVEFGATDRGDSFDFDAVLRFFVLGFDERRGERRDLVIAQVRRCG